MARRYQNGTLEESQTAQGPTWYLRFTDAEGRRPRVRIGLKSLYPTRAKASRAAQPLRDAFNTPSLIPAPARHTVADVIRRYEAEEMPARFSTRQGYQRLHRLYIEPAWGAVPLAELDAFAVRAWLKPLTGKDGLLLSSRTRGHIHGQFKNLMKFAMLWKWMPAQVNPMALFTIEGATRRARLPRVVSPAQFRALLLHFAADARLQAMLIGAYCLGLRSSELFALQWADFDHLGEIVWIRRAIVQGHVDVVKTERSEAPLPLAPFVNETFLRWRSSAAQACGQAGGILDPAAWVFASPYRAGRLPMDANNLQAKYLLPAGRAIALNFPLGWHTLRHSYKSLLDRVCTDASLKRDLMRHADVHTTMQVYGEVEMDRLRVANNAAVLLATTALV